MVSGPFNGFNTVFVTRTRARTKLFAQLGLVKNFENVLILCKEEFDDRDFIFNFFFLIIYYNAKNWRRFQISDNRLISTELE